MLALVCFKQHDNNNLSNWDDNIYFTIGICAKDLAHNIVLNYYLEPIIWSFRVEEMSWKFHVKKFNPIFIIVGVNVE